MTFNLHAQKRLFKGTLLAMVVISLAAIVYTAVNAARIPYLPDEMVLPLFSEKTDGATTARLARHLTEAQTLSEDYVLETDSGRLGEIEAAFEERLIAIDTELSRLAQADDAGLEIIVSNLMRLSHTFQDEARETFRQHRRALGMKG